MNVEQLSATLAAVASPQRMLILTELSAGRVHVSELARRVGMSRALLYMHLAKLEATGFVTTALELSPEGTALKHVSLAPFSLTVDIAVITQAVANAATTHE
ncbi:ArsR family transcriptional regulator [Cryobacterium frigoriphilum]|uniref:ArsR family transcriptional regulator n=1 Tax=Cryobacterium frigoriphilum TaxID=1259150 RepID=A0A4R8ZV24_9MICO|nr:winged helix-turn-helix domain-containing protein [Cryobacterium frigoriphilum]TFD46995.1 ArsR family transcriptional regulator [Cryobacterium frigoriphilum]